MSNSVQMPALGESVTEGTVTRWLKQVGEQVEVDEPLLEVSTDKVDTEIPSPFAGTVEQILADEDETVEVGADLAVIGDGSGASDSDAGAAGAAAEAPAEEQPAEPAEQPDTQAAESQATESPAAESQATESSSGDQPAGEGSEVTMPALGESVTEGTVTRWLKEVGEQVEVDEPLLEVSTDKVDTEIPSPLAGTLQKVLVSEDETVEVGAALAVIGSGAPAEAAPAPAPAPEPEPAPEPAAPEPAAQSQTAPEPQDAPAPAPSAAVEQETAPPAPGRQPAPQPAAAQSSASSSAAPATGAPRAAVDSGGYVTPLVRKLAAEKNVDLSSLTGTGVGGRIRKQDVLDAAEKPATASTPAPTAISEEAAKLRGTVQKAPRIRQTIAKRMKESLDISAQLTSTVEVDMTRVAALRAKAKTSFLENEGVKLSFLPFIAKAVTEALKTHPKINAAYNGDSHEITYFDAEHLAIAVDTERGLLVPVIRDAGDLSLAGLAGKIADLAERTRTNKIGPDELSGGTFTITNIGSVGALFDTPIINQPQVGILGTGAIVKRPVVVTNADGDDSIAIRSMMYLPLTYDHRLVDGADAGRFLQTIKARLEEGAFESELGL